MDSFSLEIEFRNALALYVYLKQSEENLSGAPAALYESLRSYLYERLSIEEMEEAETLLARLSPRN
jgi:hypothetical protein